MVIPCGHQSESNPFLRTSEYETMSETFQIAGMVIYLPGIGLIWPFHRILKRMAESVVSCCCASFLAVSPSWVMPKHHHTKTLQSRHTPSEASHVESGSGVQLQKLLIEGIVIGESVVLLCRLARCPRLIISSALLDKMISASFSAHRIILLLTSYTLRVPFLT